MGVKMFVLITALVFHCQLSFVVGGFVNHHPWDDPDYAIEAAQDEFKGEIITETTQFNAKNWLVSRT